MSELSKPPVVYQLKVWLRGISPMVWRRLLVRSDSTIADLHYAIQSKDYVVSHIGGMSFADDPERVHLSDFGFRIRERFLYEYDFGAEMRGKDSSSVLCSATTGWTMTTTKTMKNWRTNRRRAVASLTLITSPVAKSILACGNTREGSTIGCFHEQGNCVNVFTPNFSVLSVSQP